MASWKAVTHSSIVLLFVSGSRPVKKTFWSLIAWRRSVIEARHLKETEDMIWRDRIMHIQLPFETFKFLYDIL